MQKITVQQIGSKISVVTFKKYMKERNLNVE